MRPCWAALQLAGGNAVVAVRTVLSVSVVISPASILLQQL